jgi:hypothetical protein
MEGPGAWFLERVGEWVGGGGADVDDPEEGGRGDLSSIKKI